MAAPSVAPAVKPPKALSEYRDFSVAEIAAFNGTEGKPIYIGADGLVFNMSSHESGPAFYGPGGPYGVFAGRDASVGLALMETDEKLWHKHTVAELSVAERDALGNWVDRFRAKYDIVGCLNDGSSPLTVAEARTKKFI